MLDLKVQLDEAREKHKEEHETQESIINELRKKVEQLEEDSTRKSDSIQKGELFESQLKETQEALNVAQANENTLKKEIEQLGRRLKDTETQIEEVFHSVDVVNCRRCPKRNLLTKYEITEIL
jgi:chromosome segregation ATPase